MKNFHKIIILSALLPFSAICSAEPPKDPVTTDAKMMERDKAPMDPIKMEAHLKEIQAHQLMMHDLSNKILAETDPAKQQALKDQQLELMKTQHMKMMSEHQGRSMHHKKMQ